MMQSIRDLVANDGYAITFQAMGQYRTALLKAIDEAASPASISTQPARYAINGAIAFGRMGIMKPETGHWLMEYWSIGQQLAELGKTSAWDNQTPVDAPRADHSEDASQRVALPAMEYASHEDRMKAIGRAAPSASAQQAAPVDLLQAILDEIGSELFDMQSAGTWLRVADTIRKVYAADAPSEAPDDSIPQLLTALGEVGVQVNGGSHGDPWTVKLPSASPAALTHADGWLQDGGLIYRLTDERHPQNRDEINVSMADGSRNPEVRAARAGEILALFAASPADQVGWQPIETAPKDGTVVDLWVDGRRRSCCYWGLPSHCCGEDGRYCDSEWHDLKEGWVDGYNEPRSWNPTHWMPLPSAPSIDAAMSASKEGV